ncbi:MAG: glycosyltransferase [Planctomycetales bacterium]
MIRVVHVIPSLRYSGAARQLALLAARLPPDEFDVRVAALEPGGPLEQPLAAANVRVDALGRRLTFDPGALWRLRALLDEFRPQIVHAWEATAHNYARLAMGGGGGRRLVATETRCRSKTGLERWVDHRLIERTSWMLVNCRALADECARGGFPRERLAVVPWGVDIPREEPVDRRVELAAFGIPGDARVAGYVGELTRARRGRDLVWGINLLSQLTSRVCFLAIGDGPERARLEEYARQIERAEFVRLPGEGDARRAMRLMSLYWSVGEEESLSSALLEAMAAGLPAIVSDTPAHRELVRDGETGIVIDVGDSVGLAQFSDRLLADPDRARELGAAARGRVRAEFSVEKMVDTHAELYRSLAREIAG